MGDLTAAKKVLVVDDYRAIRELLAKFLNRSGFPTRTASNGREAFEAFQRDEPDLLISDVQVPHMNGLELTRQIRAISSIPILIMTAGLDYMGDEKEAAIDAGADSFLMKPFGLADMLGEIRLLLARTAAIRVCRKVGEVGRS
jgi:two-component system KDP operon response regulator KdpE